MKNESQDLDDVASVTPDDAADLKKIEELMGPEPKKPNLSDASYGQDDGEAEKEIETENEKETEIAPEEEIAGNPVVDSAVDDIVAKEGDEVLEAEDAKLAAAFTPGKPPFKERLKNFMAAWWRNKWARYGTLFVIIMLIAGVFVLPTTRYAIFNAAGVRASTYFSVTDEKSGQPLKKVDVKIDQISAKTGDDGAIRFNNLRLGKHQLEIAKPGFATIKKSVVLGWGSNPMPKFELTATGSRFTFKLVDWLSGKPIKPGKEDEVTTADNTAKIDDKGVAELTIEPTENAEIDVNVQVAGYRREKIKVKVAGQEPITVKMVPGHPVVFVSKRSGKYDVYKIDADGKNEKLLIKGTGSEQGPNLAVQSNAKGTMAALVSTRDNKVNNDGFVMSGLFVVDLSSGELHKVDESERIQLVDWNGDKLVYVKVAQGASGTNPKRHRLVTYDIDAETSKELAASNFFNDVLVADGKIFYAPSNSFLENPTAFLYRINPDGSGKQTVLEKEVWNIYRTDEKTLTLAVQQDYYSLDLTKDEKAKKITKPAATPANRFYVPSPSSSTKLLWIDNRDGKGVLLLNTPDKKDQVLVTKSGLKYPLRWLNDHTVVFRVSTPQETADYALNLEGGEPQKIKDVSDTPGIGLWYYY